MAIVLAARVAAVVAVQVYEVAVLVDVLQGMEQRRLPAGKQRDEKHYTEANAEH